MFVNVYIKQLCYVFGLGVLIRDRFVFKLETEVKVGQKMISNNALLLTATKDARKAKNHIPIELFKGLVQNN